MTDETKPNLSQIISIGKGLLDNATVKRLTKNEVEVVLMMVYFYTEADVTPARFADAAKAAANRFERGTNDRHTTTLG